MEKIRIFDTTLRDGEQSPGCSMNIEEKINLAKHLEKLKVDVIEAGFAGSSKGDSDSIFAIAKTIKDSSVCSLCRCLESDIDASYQALKYAVDPLIHLFIATSPLHIQIKLKMTEDEVVSRAVQMIKYAKSLIPNVEMSFEDASRSNLDFLSKMTYECIKAGASVINIPDTVGFATPNEMQNIIEHLYKNVVNINDSILSVHCHNDLGLALSNSIGGVLGGARQIECTLNGIGERAGNAPLEELAMLIDLKYNDRFFTNIDKKHIYSASRALYKIIGITPPLNKAIVGLNTFAHESGIHQHGVQLDKRTYEIFNPEDIGMTKNNLILGKHSGKHALFKRIEELGYSLSELEEIELFEKFKQLCDKKKVVTDLDIEAIVTSSSYIDKNGYKLKSFDIHAGNLMTAVCVIRLEKQADKWEEVALGDGPISSAFNAIDKITGLSDHYLDKYSVHSITEGRDALGEVIVKLNYKDKMFVGKGVSTDIIEASILAYINAINKVYASILENKTL